MTTTMSRARAEALARNRRESFRINDRVALSARALSESEYREARGRALERFEKRRTLNSVIAAAESQRGALRNIRDSEPAIAAYLQGLEERLEQIARLLSREGHSAPDEASHEVNISGNGIRFHHHEPLTRGSRVRIDIQLFPSRTCLSLIGTVVRSREREQTPRGSGRFVTAVDFTDIHDDDRELLIRHVHEVQTRAAQRGVLRG